VSETTYLLDTNIILMLVRGNELGTHINTRFGLHTSKIRPMICVVTHGEIYVLARRRGWGDKKIKVLENTLNNLVTVNINHPAVLDAYIEIDLYSQQHPTGARNMGKNDLWIAACAKAAGAKLLSTDRDFEHLGDLFAVEYIDPAMVKR